jgi:hypothetical protein
MGFYIFDSHEVGPLGKLELIKKIPGVKELDRPPVSASDVIRVGMYPVCWVDNTIFQAAGIAYDNEELRRFETGTHGRPHKWFLVPTEELVKLKSHLVEYLRGERGWRE